MQQSRWFKHWASWVCLSLLLFSAVSARAEVAATVIFSTALAQATSADGQVREIKRGSELASGDLLDTRDATVQLQFRDGASMTLKPSTRLRIDAYRYSGSGAETPADDVSILSLLRGGFRTLTGWIGKKHRSQYRVGSAVATIGIRGTNYSADLDDAGLRVHTIAGAVEVCNLGGCVVANPGDRVAANSNTRKPEFVDEKGLPAVQRDEIGLPPPKPGTGSSIDVPARTAPPPPPPPPPNQTAPYSPNTARGF